MHWSAAHVSFYSSFSMDLLSHPGHSASLQAVSVAALTTLQRLTDNFSLQKNLSSRSNSSKFYLNCGPKIADVDVCSPLRVSASLFEVYYLLMVFPETFVGKTGVLWN